MLQGTLYKDMGRTGGVVKLEIDPNDKVPETQDLENREEIIRKGYFHMPVKQDADSYVESIITSKFRRVKEAPSLMTEEKEPEYESAEQIFESDIKDYLRLLKYFFINIMILLGGIISGVGMLHFYVLFFSEEEERFLNMYAKIAKGVESIFHVFGFLCAIFALFLALVNYSSWEKAVIKMSPKVSGYRCHCILYLFICARISSF